MLQLLIEDVTPDLMSKRTKGKNGNGASKVLVSDFNNPKLAIFAKRCARMATCIVNMCPGDPHFSWPTLKEEVERLVQEGRGDEFINDLAEMSKDVKLRDQLVRFVSNLHLH
jgi:hypothetical protein